MEITEKELFDLINAFNQKLDETAKSVQELKQHIYDDFLKPAQDNYNEWDKENRFNEFKERNPFDESLTNELKAVEGDDFDLAKKLFDDYEASDKSVEESEYVANVVASLTEQLKALKEKLNAEKVEVEANEDGTVEVKADDQPVAEAVEVEADADAVKEEGFFDKTSKALDDFIKGKRL
jgi:regulator of replication initiation timing